MKKIILIFILLLVLSAKPVAAIYDPLSHTNNKFGIHILFTSEVSEASTLINSSGGDWGYVTIPIKSSDRDLVKWQKFMDDCKKYHIIPIIRLATDGDFFDKVSWSKPTDYDVLDFANFLNNLSWPTKNRYIVVFNETNRGDEWGGTPNASEYADILNYAVDIFKEKNKDFFIIMAGLDNASINIPGSSINNYTYMYQMEDSDPGIFSKIDGIASHSYPNPAFLMPPSKSNTGIYSFYYQRQLAKELSGKNLPVFITETGWSSDAVSESTQSIYYINAFSDYWNDSGIVAVTPFLFHAEQGSFSNFSFIKNTSKTKMYDIYKNFPKEKGDPELAFDNTKENKLNSNLPFEDFKRTTQIDNVFSGVNNSAKSFFKWLLKL